VERVEQFIYYFNRMNIRRSLTKFASNLEKFMKFIAIGVYSRTILRIIKWKKARDKRIRRLLINAAIGELVMKNEPFMVQVLDAAIRDYINSGLPRNFGINEAFSDLRKLYENKLKSFQKDI
jgi:hypothetical protein